MQIKQKYQLFTLDLATNKAIQVNDNMLIQQHYDTRYQNSEGVS